MGDGVSPEIVELVSLQENPVWPDPDLSILNEGRRTPPQLPQGTESRLTRLGL